MPKFGPGIEFVFEGLFNIIDNMDAAYIRNSLVKRMGGGSDTRLSLVFKSLIYNTSHKAYL